MVFFILSGFIITYVSMSNERSLVEFSTKRISRYFSILIPAIALLIIASLITTRINPHAYTAIDCGNSKNIALKTIASLTFINYNTFTTAQCFLPAGGPFWSLTCEWWYYVLYALAFHIPNRLVSFFLSMILVSLLGPSVMLLFPVWLIGSFCHLAWRRISISKKFAIFIAILTPCLAVILWASNVRYSFLNTAVLSGHYFHHATYFPYYWLIGALMGSHLLCMLITLHEPSKLLFQVFSIIAPVIRRISGTSFFLYVAHMPIMILLKTIFGETIHSYLIPTFTLAVCLIFGKYIEDLRFPLQKILRPRLAGLSHWITTSKTGAHIIREPLRASDTGSRHCLEPIKKSLS